MKLLKIVSELPAAVSLTHTQAFSYFPFYHMKNNHITHSINSSLLEQILGHFWVFVQLIQLFLKNFLNSIGDGECWLVLLCYVSQKEKKTSLSHFYCYCPQDHDGHGPEFLKHMQRINAESGANITVSIFSMIPTLQRWECFTNILLCLDPSGKN